MRTFKTPAQIAAMFGCTVEQAADQLRANLANEEKMLAKAKVGKTGAYRGFTVANIEGTIAAMKTALQ